MEMVRLGGTGLKVSKICLGTMTYGDPRWRDWVLDETASMPFFRAAIEAGINFFDTADMYSTGASEIVTGKALKEYAAGREEVVLATKLYNPMGRSPNQRGLSRKWVMSAIDNSLKRLGTDYVDLYQIHRFDNDTPIEETVRAMHNLIVQGKVLYWGTSEWSAQQLTEAYAVARAHDLTPPTMEQPEYNLFRREKVEAEFLPLYDLFGLGTTIWSPLASGILTGKYNNGIAADSRIALPGYEWLKARLESDKGKDELAKVSKLAKLADEAGMPIHHLALLWCLQNPHVSTVILGASKLSQL